MELTEINELRKAAGQDPLDEGLWDTIKAGASGLAGGARQVGSEAGKVAQKAAAAVAAPVSRIAGAAQAGARASMIRSHQAALQKVVAQLLDIRGKLESLGMDRNMINRTIAKQIADAGAPATPTAQPAPTPTAQPAPAAARPEPVMASMSFDELCDKFIAENNLKD